MAAAVEALEQRFGWAISYEDPRFENEAEIEDVANAVRMDGDPSRSVLIPRGGPFEFRYDVKDSSRSSQPLDILQALVARYEAAGYPGRFVASESSGMFHITPTGVRNKEGNVVPQSSVLDVSISIARIPRTGSQLLADILETVSQASGYRVEIGAMPGPAISSLMTTEGAENEAARYVLSRMLSASRAKFSWQLTYGPGTKMYFLNLRGVPSPDSVGK
jgi:hypothetical protein